MKASANSDRVVFCRSQIDLSSDIDLSGPHYNISCLTFFGGGGRKENDWMFHPELVERLIKAISLCSMKDSLKTLKVCEWDIEVEEVEDMLKKHNLNNVQVVEEDDDLIVEEDEDLIVEEDEDLMND